MPLNLKHLDYFKNVTFKEYPDFGARLYELLSNAQQGVTNIEQQTNSNAQGDPPPPPAINALMVSANDGHFQIGINHEGAEFYRGVQYFIDHADNPNFINAHTIDLGTTRNHSIFLGNATRYWRAYAAYPGSKPGPMAYHGSPSQPKPVNGGGSIQGPAFSRSQSSGTGTTGQTGQGPGTIPYRTSTGKPPVR